MIKNIDHIKTKTLIDTLLYYNSFLYQDIPKEPPGPPNRFYVEWRPWKTKKLNKIADEIYNTRKLAHSLYLSKFYLIKELKDN